MTHPVPGGDAEELLLRARQLDAAAQVPEAKLAYVEVLRRDPTHLEACLGLGRLAEETGHRSAARTAFQQAVLCHPDNAPARVNFGNALCEAGDFSGARREYEAALTLLPGLPEAHMGLGRVASEQGDDALADQHWRQGFAERAMVVRPYRGTGPAIPALLLVAARAGNLAAGQFLDPRVFAVTLLCPEFYGLTKPLPPHALIVNAIGDADLCARALTAAETLVRGSAAPVINPPERILLTGRAANAARLGKLEGVIAPDIQTLERDSLRMGSAALRFPLLLRTPGFHTGRHFVRVERPEKLGSALDALPGRQVLAIEYLDARGSDGMARKYRVMFIDHVPYPLHLAVSRDWKVHYFSAEMGRRADYRAEERRFLEDMPAVLGTRVLAALAAIERSLGLDYAGIDFAIGRDGSVLLFEANATMVVYQPDADPMWNYRRAPIDRVLDAARQMLVRRCGVHPMGRH